VKLILEAAQAVRHPDKATASFANLFCCERVLWHLRPIRLKNKTRIVRVALPKVRRHEKGCALIRHYGSMGEIVTPSGFLADVVAYRVPCAW
jgi:hypothetical protein